MSPFRAERNAAREALSPQHTLAPVRCGDGLPRQEPKKGRGGGDPRFFGAAYSFRDCCL